MAVHGSRKRLRPRALAPLLAVAGLATALFAVGIVTLRASDSERLVDLLLEERFTAGRLSGATAWEACTEEDSAGFVPRTDCGESQNLDEFERLSDRIAEADSSPATRRGLALLELRVAHDVPGRLWDAAESLQIAADAAPRDAALRNDLAVTYLGIAEREQRLDPMLRALENVERAYTLDPDDRSILFNRALIRQRLHLVHEAEQAWLRYLDVERNRRWRREAERHLATVRSIPDTVSWDTLLNRAPPRLDVVWRGLIHYRAKYSPQIAREFSFPLLAAWGTAVLTDSTVRAERWLAIAREIGGALTSDSSVALALAAIDSAASNADRLRALAEGHVALSEGFRFNEKGEYAQADTASEEAERWLRQGRSPAARWATFYRASAEANKGEADSATVRLALLQGATRSNEPSLLGKIIWGRGLLRLRLGEYGIADSTYRDAAPLIDLAAEMENRGTVATLISEALILSGRTEAADTFGFRALERLAPYRRSKYLGYHLNILAGSVRAAGLSHAALALTTEAIAVAQARYDDSVAAMPSQLALFHSARALDHAVLGDGDYAAEDLENAQQWVAKGNDSAGRSAVLVQLARGQIMRLQNPATALLSLDSVVRRFLTQAPRDLYLPSAFYETALAAQATGKLDLAGAYLAQGMAHVEAQRASFEKSKNRAAFYETVENLFDLEIALAIDQRDSARAFAALERGRVSFWADERDSAAPLTLDRVRAALPDSTMLVEYALLSDRLIIWTVTRSLVRHHVVLVPRTEIAELADRFEHYTSTGQLRSRASAAGRLFNLLVLPITPQLAGVRQLAIVPDRELHNVPFAALWNADSARFLIESHTLSTVPSAAFYLNALAKPTPTADGATALVVGNPTLHPDLQVDLISLGGAESEANQIAALYRTVPLTLANARRDRVRARLNSHSVFHFAGHAVFNAEAPEESYLALAPDGGEGEGKLRAWEIENMGLSNLQVVVLSACSTLGQRATRTGPASGLAYSFLTAGVPATVSTLWDVPDSTSATLLVNFHRHLDDGASPAEALRQAQIRAIGEGRIPPRAWAAFVYTGP